MGIERQLQNEYENSLIVMLIGTKDENKRSHILEHLNSDMFIFKEYKEIYETIVSMKKNNIEIEIDNIIKRIKKESNKRLAADLNKEFITAGNCDYYLEKIHESYFKRLLKECDSFEGYKYLEKLKEKYKLKADTKKIYSEAEEFVVEYFNRWDDSIQTYFPSIDNAIGSLQGGDLLILAGATGMGKTCMMLNLLKNMALNGKKVLLFSLEMSLQQLQNRIISAETGVDSDKVRNFTMTQEEFQRYSDYALSDDFKKLDIDVNTDYEITIEKIKRVVMNSDADIVFIDYLGLIKSDFYGTTYDRVSEISRNLKLLALASNRPFIVLHQLSRIPNDRKEKRPLLSDLRDSGKIEQDADFICFVFREHYYDKTKDEKLFEFIISKSRFSKGRCTCTLFYDGSHQKITDPIGKNKKSVHDQKQEVGRQCSLGV